MNALRHYNLFEQPCLLETGREIVECKLVSITEWFLFLVINVQAAEQGRMSSEERKTPPH